MAVSSSSSPSSSTSSSSTSFQRSGLQFLTESSSRYNKILLIFNDPRIVDPYRGKREKEPAFTPIAAQVGGTSLGTLYEKKSTKPGKPLARYLGKVGIGKNVFVNDPRTFRAHTKSEMNLEVILEEIAYSFYRALSKGLFRTPKTYLSRQPIIDEFTRFHSIALFMLGTPADLINGGFSGRDAPPDDRRLTNESLRIMSSFISGYQDFQKGRALTPEGDSISFIDYIERMHRPPESLLTPEGKEVPLKGVMALLAVARIIGDTDVIGGDGGNAGFVWIRDENQEIIAAETVKIDPGMAFQFGENDELNWATNTFHRRRTRTARGLVDIRDLQVAQQYDPITIQWQSITPAQKTEFLQTFYNSSYLIHSDEAMHYLFYREGRFNQAETEQIPETVARQFQSQLINWIDIQHHIYTEEMIINEEFYLAVAKNGEECNGLVQYANTESRWNRELVLEAVGLFEESLAMKKRLYSDRPHSAVADSLTNLGEAHTSLYNYERAFEYYETAFAMRKELCDDRSHPAIVGSLINLGNAHTNLCDYDQAINFHNAALAMGKQLHGDHPHSSIAYSLIGLGDAYYRLAECSRAIELYDASLVIFKRIHSDQPHRDIARNLNSLGLAYNGLGKPYQAIKFYDASLTMFKQIYGDQPHPDIASSLNNLGCAYQSLGKVDRAVEFCEFSLKMYRQVYGDRPHPNLATNLSNLGIAYRSLSLNHQALEKYLESKRSFHHDCPHLSTVGGSGDHSYDSLGEMRRAIELCEASLAMYKQVYRDRPHPDVAESLENLGFAYTKINEAPRAVELCKAAVEMYKQIYGDRFHPNIAESLLTLGSVYDALGTTHQSIMCDEAALVMYERFVDECFNSNRFKSVADAWAYYNLKEINRAIRHCKISLAQKKRGYSFISVVSKIGQYLGL